MKIKTGDMVRVMAGKDKGKEGKVLQTFPKLSRVVVENVNMMTRHLKSRQAGTKGQKIQFPSPIHASNLKVVTSKMKDGGRVGYKFIEKDGVKKKVRVLKRQGKTEDLE